ncbi:class I SAM-dependent methyltransferase [Methylobacterium sp. J-090]|uniref:class I SAM-dependent methyltransferase n=1 Tax=Methylobacterium sp. J-090 TaxID=2836666 RepID=UPI001FBC01FA|nr:class I SAM-dependent methyltransferase [Methylobacterium sp. J-090]MCJ2084154.1 class I SAM-dependent methyltransferase [Methylobacterium sp. J-090]
MSRSAEPEAMDFIAAFNDPQAAAHYAEGPRRFVPGYEALHRMTAILLAEGSPANARVLVLGAGGGLELRALAEAHPTWSFVGIDPAREMLKEAERVLGPLMDRVTLVEGYIDDAPSGPFDAAACLLTLHFLEPAERAATVRAIHQRLKQGAPFVAAHGSFPQGEDERPRWLDRYESYAVASGSDRVQAHKARTAVGAHLPTLSPEQDANILSAGGFSDVALFFAAFTWRGWVARA